MGLFFSFNMAFYSLDLIYKKEKFKNKNFLFSREEYLKGHTYLLTYLFVAIYSIVLVQNIAGLL